MLMISLIQECWWDNQTQLVFTYAEYGKIPTELQEL